MSEIKEIKLADLPYCTIRMGRIFDGKAIISCGFREIKPEECIECGGDISILNKKINKK